MNKGRTGISLWIPSQWLLGMTVVVLSLLISSVTFAKGPGTTTGELMKIPVGTRAIGMGESYTALSDDASAFSWNPAGAVSLVRKEASFMHSDLIEGIHYEHLSLMVPTEAYTFGASMAYLGYGDIAGYDNSGNATGNVTANGFIMTGGLARQAWDSLAYGISLDFLRQTLANTSAGTVAANVGALYTLPTTLWQGTYKLGFSALHLGPGLKFVDESAPLPRKYKFGAAVTGIKEKPVAFTMDFTVPNDNDPYLALGTEYTFKEMIALRMGYIGSNDEGKGLRLGVGLLWQGMTFDYAYGGFGDFGATHRFSLSMKFGETVEKLNKEQRNTLRQARLAQRDGNYTLAMEYHRQLTESYPDSTYLMRQMVRAHEAMTGREKAEELAQQKQKEIPDIEDFARQDLVPGEEPVAAALPGGMIGNLGYSTPRTDPAKFGPDTGVDYIGEANLPDVTDIDAEFMAKPVVPAPAVIQSSPETTTLDPVTKTGIVAVESTPHTPTTLEPAMSAPVSNEPTTPITNAVAEPRTQVAPVENMPPAAVSAPTEIAPAQTEQSPTDSLTTPNAGQASSDPGAALSPSDIYE